MEREWELLFGVLAVQFHKAAPNRIAEAVPAWIADPSTSLRDRLVTSGAISETSAEEVARLVGVAIDAHGSSVEALAAFDGDQSVRRSFLTTETASEAYTAAKMVLGITLRDAIARASGWKERLQLLPYVIDAARIAGAAHARGIVHRNLHPSGIMVGEYGEIVVLDWSLSKVRGRNDARGADIERAAHALRNGAKDEVPPGVALAPSYLAPELALGHMESVDARSDVYALGAIVYELLTGQPPFGDASARNVLSNAASKKPESVASLAPDAPQDLAAICERAMHQEPSARYANGKVLADELQRVTAAPSSKSEQARDASAGTPSKFSYGIAAAVVLVVIGIAAVTQQRVVGQRNEALSALRAEEQKRVSAEESRDQLKQDLEEARQARQAVQTERDMADAARARAEENTRKLQQTLLPREAKPPSETAEPEPPAAEPPAPRAPERPASQMPSFMIPPENPQRPPGVTKSELAKALPELTGNLTMEQGPEGQTAITLRLPNGQTTEGLQKLGFKEGDVITNVNRTSVETVDAAKKALSNVVNDPGFTVRIVREGQSSWMRVNVMEVVPPTPSGPPEAPHAPAEQVSPEEAPAAHEPAAEEAAPAHEKSEPTEAAPAEAEPKEAADAGTGSAEEAPAQGQEPAER